MKNRKLIINFALINVIIEFKFELLNQKLELELELELELKLELELNLEYVFLTRHETLAISVIINLFNNLYDVSL